MKIRSVLWMLFLAALFLVLALMLIFRLQRQSSVLDAVPDQASGVLYIQSTAKFTQRTLSAAWWHSLTKSDFFKTLSTDIALLDTMLIRSGLSKSLKDCPSALALLETADESAMVYYAQVGNNFPYWDLHEKALPSFGSRFELIKRKTSGYNTFLLLDRQNRRQLSYAFTGGLAIASFNREAFEMALISLDKDKEAGFKAIFREHSSPVADAVALLHPQRLASQLQALFTASWSSAITQTAGAIDQWVVFDLHLRENELMMSGLLEDAAIWKSVDSEARINADSLSRWLPLSTLSFQAWYQKTDDSSATDEFGLSGIVVEGRAAQSGTNLPFVVFVPDEPNRVAEVVFANQPRISSPWDNLWTAPVEAPVLAKGMIKKVKHWQENRVFVTSNGRLYFFSSDLRLLRNYIDTKAKGLSDSDISRLSEAVSNRSGMMLYHQLSKAAGRLAEVSQNRLKFRLARDVNVLHGFESVSVQLSRADRKVYASVLIRSNTNPMGQAIPQWTVKLDAAGAAAPFLFSDEGEGRVIAFDSAGWMYGFSPEGRRLWKRQIGGIPLGNPVVIKYSFLKRPYLLFNTAASVFMMDANGNQAAGFPLQLPSRATSNLTHASEPAPVIYVNCADRRIYAFNLSGKPATNWSPPLLTDISTVPPYAVSSGEAGYVIISSIDGFVKILDENGLERIRLREPLVKAEGADIHLNRTNARGIFLTSGPQGELLFIGSGGVSRIAGPERFSRGHYFFYEDFDADQSPDFMYADGRRVVVFDRFNRNIFDWQLQAEVVQKPYFLHGSANQGIWCFEFPQAGMAAIAANEFGILTFSRLPRGEKYGFGRTDPGGSLMLAAYDSNELILFRLN